MFARHSKAKGLSLGVGSGAYAASAPKDIPKVLSRKARAKALFSANYLAVMKRTGHRPIRNPTQPLR